MGDSATAGWAHGIGALTLFVDDLAAARQFSIAVFGLPIHYEDGESVVFRFGETLVNLLASSSASDLIDPALVAPMNQGSRLQLTIDVDDVDAMCAELERKGVRLLNGPMDRPWGVRTASFVDPGGHIWEIAK